MKLADVLEEALAVHEQRQEAYRDNWRRQGWRGSLFKLRLKVERAWDVWWGAEPQPEPDVDDLLDVINYAAMTVVAIREGDRDGTWRFD